MIEYNNKIIQLLLLLNLETKTESMGCGACGPCFDSHKVHQPTQSILTVSSALSNLIKQYRTFVSSEQESSKIANNKLHPILSLDECQLVVNLIASKNEDIPALSVESLANLKKMEQEKHFLAANAPNTDSPLLDQISRIIWKCLLLIPEHINPTPHNIIHIPYFKAQIPDSQQKAQYSFHQISLDVNRTFPGNKLLNRQHLTILLRNLVNCLSGIGYTQGMNFYAGFLLLCGFSPQQAYYLFISLFISHDIFIAHNFNDFFKQVITCTKILTESLSEKLSKHLGDSGISQQLYSFSWFLCSYLYTLNLDSCLIIWDYMIKSGICGHSGGGFTVIINIAIRIMQKLQTQLMKSEAPDILMTLLRAQNINQTFPPLQIEKIIGEIKQKNEQFAKYGEISKKHQKKSKFRKHFITRKQMIEYDKQLKQILTTKEGYQKCMQGIFGLDRASNQKSMKIQNKDSYENDVQHVGEYKNIKAMIIQQENEKKEQNSLTKFDNNAL